MDEEKSLVRYIIGANRIKYSVLDQLYRNINLKGFNMGVMYVDAHSIFSRLFSARNNEVTSLFSDHENECIRDLVVGFLNVLGHYRRYMAKHLMLDNEIFVVFNPVLSDYHREHDRSWRFKEYKRYKIYDPDRGFVAECILRAYKFIVSLSPYFEGIYCIDNKGIDDFALMAKMGFHRKDILYTIYSRNRYAMQFIQNNVVQLVNRRDNSYLLTIDNWFRTGIASKNGRPYKVPEITPDMLPLFWTLCGCQDVCVDRISCFGGIGTIIKNANQMIEDNGLRSGISIQSFLSAYQNYTKSGWAIQKDMDLLEHRYKVLSADVAAAGITADQLARVKAMCYDVYNETELEKLNEILAAGEVDPELIEIGNLNMSEAISYE